MRDIVDLVLDRCVQWPDRTAIQLVDRAITYAMVSSGVASVRRTLREQGLVGPVAVGLSITDPARHFIVALAVMANGGCCVPLPAGWSGRLADLGVATVLTDRPALLAGARAIVVDGGWFARPGGDRERSSDVAPDRVARVEFTSGSTGMTKAVGATREALFHQNTGRIAAYGQDVARALCLFPIGSAIGFSFLLSRLMIGNSVAFAESDDQVIDMVNYFAIEGLLASPIQCEQLLDQLSGSGRRVGSVRRVILAGSPPSRTTLEKIRATFGAEILLDYGSSETGLAAIARVDFPLAEGEPAIGFVPIQEIAVDPVEDADDPRIGRIRIRAQGTGWPFSGRLEQTDADRGEGWFQTNDLGFFSEAGLLVLKGRADSVLNLGGVKISPEQFETILRGNRDIADVAVADLGETGRVRPTVFVVKREGADLPVVEAWIRANLPKYVDWRICPVDRIPRTPTGKIVRGELSGGR